MVESVSIRLECTITASSGETCASFTRLGAAHRTGAGASRYLFAEAADAGRTLAASIRAELDQAAHELVQDAPELAIEASAAAFRIESAYLRAAQHADAHGEM